jgi:hypothetical protein
MSAAVWLWKKVPGKSRKLVGLFYTMPDRTCIERAMLFLNENAGVGDSYVLEVTERIDPTKTLELISYTAPA